MLILKDALQYPMRRFIPNSGTLLRWISCRNWGQTPISDLNFCHVAKKQPFIGSAPDQLDGVGRGGLGRGGLEV